MSYIKKSKEEMVLLGLQRATMENLKTKKRGNVFKVTNNEGDSVYTVQTDENTIKSCDCPHNTHRHVVCKHMFAVLLTSRNKYQLPL
jgi:uncharacterized Zn finger protein